jgi:hypothetical protein
VPAEIVDEPLAPQRRISSRMLQLVEDEFDIDLNPLDTDERDNPDEQFLNNFTYERGFDNIKRFDIGPQLKLKFNRADPSVHQLNLMMRPHGHPKHQTQEVPVKIRLQWKTP